MRLKDKVAVITGAGTGIGRATALAFAREGAAVMAAGRREEPIREVAEMIVAAGGEALFQATDVRESDQVKRMIAKAVDHFGRLDIVVANAGANVSRTNILETSEEDWRLMVETNLTGVFLTCKHSVPHLVRAGGGAIIVTSSVIGLNGSENRIPYGATKGGVNQLVKCMAIDHAAQNVRVNAICLGRVLTDFVRHLKAPGGDWDEVEKRYPMGMRGAAEDFANAAVYLASDEAAWVTGVLLPVDGGYNAR